MVDGGGQTAVVPDHLLPGLAPGAYEGHHEGVAAGVGELVPPHPDRHRTRIREGQQDVRRHDEGVNISGDDDIPGPDLRMMFLGHHPDQLGAQDAGELAGLHQADRSSQLLELFFVFS